MSREPDRSAFKFFGGRVCLDFANTLNWRLTEAPVELIPDYAAFLRWSEAQGTVSKRAITALGEKAASREQEATAVMAGVHRLRAELIAGAADAWTRGLSSIEAINDAVSRLPPQPALVRDGARFVFDLDGSDLQQPLWPILWSLTAVLASEDAHRIGSCKADGCGWFFVDESPNRSRLWCSDGCGNRERVRRAYVRRRGKGG